MPRMNDRPAASIAFWSASEIIPASATAVTSVSRCAAMNFSMTGSIVFVSARFPSKALTISGKPSWPVSSPIVERRDLPVLMWRSSVSPCSIPSPNSHQLSPLC